MSPQKEGLTLEECLWKRLFPRALGLGALFSGAALITHILAGVSLRYALLFTGALVAFAVASVWRRTSPAQRAQVIHTIKVGLASGLLATIAYDIAKYTLSQWDPSPYNPFEAIRAFGLRLAGSTAPAAVVLGAGSAFHLLNGISFGIAFCFFLGHRGVLPGILWGVFLELFQLSLFPGWLDIRFYQEFAQISALSHVVYGAVLGYLCRYGLLKMHTIRR